MHYFFLWNTKDDILKKVDVQTTLAPIDFHCMDKKTFSNHHLWPVLAKWVGMCKGQLRAPGKTSEKCSIHKNEFIKPSSSNPNAPRSNETSKIIFICTFSKWSKSCICPLEAKNCVWNFGLKRTCNKWNIWLTAGENIWGLIYKTLRRLQPKSVQYAQKLDITTEPAQKSLYKSQSGEDCAYVHLHLVSSLK